MDVSSSASEDQREQAAFSDQPGPSGGVTKDATDAPKASATSDLMDGEGLDGDKNEDGTPTDFTYFPDPDVHNPSALEVVSWWSEFTSSHGVYYAFERGHFAFWKSLFWKILTLAATVGLIVVLVYEFQDFFEYSLNTAVETIVPTSLPFPQVTVCNTNMFDQSLQNATGIVEPKNEAELNAISQPADEFLLYTDLGGTAISNYSEVWTPVITPFGRCYNFVTDELVYKPGISEGVNVWLWLNQSNYSPDTESAGVAVFVTEKGTTITDQTSPVLVPAGASSFVSVSRTDVIRETDEPWKRCYGQSPEYSNDLCRAECINTAIRDLCGCRPIGDSNEQGNLNYCNSSHAACEDLVDTNILVACGCEPPPCREELYITRFSSARLAAKAAKNIEEELDLPEGEFALNFVGVGVNFDMIRYERITESKATSVPQLLSNLGGNMGFFMGLSLISVVEIFGELLLLRLLPRLWGDRRLYGIGQKKLD